MSDYIVYGVAIIFAIFAIVLWSGKGSFLIAGYNTASKQERARYDERKLGRVTGGGMGVIAVAIALMNYIGGDSPLAGMFIFIVIILAVATILILTNTYAKVENPPQIQMTKEESKRHRRNNIIALIIGLAACFFVIIIVFTGSIKYEFAGDSLQVKSPPWINKKIDLTTINEITIEKNVEHGARTGGVGTYRISAGNFTNEAYGKYYLFAYNQNKDYIVMKDEEHTYVLNDKTKEETNALYKELRIRMDNYD